MDHATPLITTIVAALSLAFVLALIATRLRIPPIAGYLLAGVILGPFTPGFIADVGLAQQLAEIGVILLMFGVGLHFSLRDLLEVRAIAIPGAVVQIAVATAMGWGLARWFGWGDAAGVVFGLALSVASTVVLLRALQDRHMLETERGHIAVGWLIVEDLATVLALVLLPTLPQLANGEGESGGLAGIAVSLLLTLGRVAAFVALMLIVGRRLIPQLLHFVAYIGNRELFRLAVLAIALGTAFSAALLFDVSFALGAFFAGMVLAESQLSQQAAQETLPLRDAFAVLFFVSVGMLFNPIVLIADPLGVLAVVAIIVFGKSFAAFLIVVAFRYPRSTALTISVSLAQIGEFSFILATLGVDLGVLPERGRDLVLAGSILSIMINPLLFAIFDRMKESPDWPTITHDKQLPPAAPEVEAQRDGYAIVVGYGRVGRTVVEGLQERGMPFVIVEEGDELAAEARAKGFSVVPGNAASRRVIAQADLARARWLLVAIPHAFEAARVVMHARAARADLHIIARAHSDAEADHLRALGASRVIMAEREVAQAMLDDVLAGPAPSAAVLRR